MPDETLKTVERTLDLLKTFGREAPEQTVSDLVARLGMPRSVVVRILATLERAGFVERVPTNLRRFRIGISACEVGAQYFTDNTLLRSAEDVLADLARRSGCTAYLGTLDGADVVILALHAGRAPVRFIWQAGERLPVATTALGKAMLLHLARERIDAILGDRPLAGLTGKSLRTRAELDAQLADCAARGWVPAAEESLPGVFAVGAAVLDPAGLPVAGLSLSFLRDPADPNQVPATGAAVLAAARTVARRLGASLAYRRDTLPRAPHRHPAAHRDAVVLDQSYRRAPTA